MLILIVMFLTLTCFCGCIVQSFYPFYTTEAVIESPVKNGKWKMINEKGEPEMPKPWVFENDRITTYDETGATGPVKVVYFKIEETLFVDATADEPGKDTCTWWAMQLAPVHTICRVKIQDNSLILIPINYSQIKSALKDKTIRLPHVENKNPDTLLFTASSKEWMSFLKKYRNDNQMFSEEYAMKFVMQSDPAKAGQ